MSEINWLAGAKNDEYLGDKFPHQHLSDHQLLQVCYQKARRCDFTLIYELLREVSRRACPKLSQKALTTLMIAENNKMNKKTKAKLQSKCFKLPN